ncbi:MAG: hypothetical protein L3J36_07465 [Rhodobacteraceae bacterium]|nr:hypothetical protein [Paracoccaceae bacterium]
MALLSGVFWGLGATGIKKWPNAPTIITTAAQLTVTSLFCIFLGLFVFDDSLPGMNVILPSLPIALGASILVLCPAFWQWIGGAIILIACLVEVTAGDKAAVCPITREESLKGLMSTTTDQSPSS